MRMANGIDLTALRRFQQVSKSNRANVSQFTFSARCSNDTRLPSLKRSTALSQSAKNADAAESRSVNAMMVSEPLRTLTDRLSCDHALLSVPAKSSFAALSKPAGLSTEMRKDQQERGGAKEQDKEKAFV